MVSIDNRYWRVRQRRETLEAADFELAAADLPVAGAGEVLVHARYLALDPYLARAMRTWTGEVPGWADGTVHGRLIGTVMESDDPGFSPGDSVLAVGRWQAVQAFAPAALEKLPAWIDPPSLALGVLGRSGLTAWVGLHLGGLAQGETLAVSAATGPVGATAAQLARAHGCRVIGIAGGEAKCRHAVARLGYDICLDHQLPDLAGRLAQAAPAGIDLLFENVGATSLDATLPAMRHGGRIMLAGLAQHYNDDAPMMLHHFKALLYHGLTVRGFITAEHAHLFDRAMADLRDGIAGGTIHANETIIDGIENAASAYLDMLRGSGIGKRLIRL